MEEEDDPLPGGPVDEDLAEYTQSFLTFSASLQEKFILFPRPKDSFSKFLTTRHLR